MPKASLSEADSRPCRILCRLGFDKAAQRFGLGVIEVERSNKT